MKGGINIWFAQELHFRFSFLFYLAFSFYILGFSLPRATHIIVNAMKYLILGRKGERLLLSKVGKDNFDTESHLLFCIIVQVIRNLYKK